MDLYSFSRFFWPRQLTDRAILAIRQTQEKKNRKELQRRSSVTIEKKESESMDILLPMHSVLERSSTATLLSASICAMWRNSVRTAARPPFSRLPLPPPFKTAGKFTSQSGISNSEWISKSVGQIFNHSVNQFQPVSLSGSQLFS